ncbi:hypothetical protein ABW20_dc0108807 [Dactylellina cionopaga]|nr:hypothetical protein ABW20_dc0108807 [Dactylellina cionopaga]
MNDDLPRRQNLNTDDGASPTTDAPETPPLASFPTNPPFGNFTTTTNSPTEPPQSSQPELTSTVTKVPVTTQVTVTHVVTDEFGRQSTSITVVPTTTMILSDDPSLAKGGESGSASGVTPQQKKIIIGVVVSVVGILSIVGIAGVIWRIWFSRRGGEEDHPVEPKAPFPPSLSRSSIQNNDTITHTSSVGDRRKKSTFGGMDPSSNF